MLLNRELQASLALVPQARSLVLVCNLNARQLLVLQLMPPPLLLLLQSHLLLLHLFHLVLVLLVLLDNATAVPFCAPVCVSMLWLQLLL